MRIAATDLEVAARVNVPATVTKPGAVTLAARKLVELVRELPSQPVTLSQGETGWVEIRCGGAKFRLAGLPAEEFPRWRWTPPTAGCRWRPAGSGPC